MKTFTVWMGTGEGIEQVKIYAVDAEDARVMARVLAETRGDYVELIEELDL
jgi:hypothetical protein